MLMVLFTEEFLKISGIDAQKLEFVSAPPRGEGHRFYIQIKKDSGQTKDGYKLVTVKDGGAKNENFTHLSATSEEGSYTALDT